MTDKEFEKIVSTYEKLIYTVCYNFCKNHHTAEDLTQETFISAYSHINSCPPNALKPWLMRIATNKAKDFLKSAYNKRVTCTEDNVMDIMDTNAYSNSSENIALSKETISQITDEIQNLKEPYNKVCTMFFLEEKSIEEISDILDRPYKTVHTQIYRGKNILQNKLKGEF